jgi:hypothetical protein
MNLSKKITALLCLLFMFTFTSKAQSTGNEERAYWVETLTQIADPVLTNLSNNTLHQNLPFESLLKKRTSFVELEAVGRLICGIAPWLELGPDNTPEGKLRDKYIKLTVKGLSNGVNPDAADYLNFGRDGKQPLVDAAFLAQGLLRAPKQLWGNFDQKTKDRMITEFKRSRQIEPNESNWLLFASTVEAALLEFTGSCDMERLTYGVKRFRDEWYRGDAQYGDGEDFHMDYYNSYVIHPMLTDVILVMKKHNLDDKAFAETQLKRHIRYAEILERFISPEGTYPVVGRSIPYRFGAMHALSQIAWMKLLPKHIKPAQVRAALTAVIRNHMEFPGNFDANGWLTVSFNGDKQLNISESYINTGSVYLCAMGLLALGLPAADPFWTDPYADWTSKKAWAGKPTKRDHALY